MNFKICPPRVPHFIRVQIGKDHETTIRLIDLSQDEFTAYCQLTVDTLWKARVTQKNSPDETIAEETK